MTATPAHVDANRLLSFINNPEALTQAEQLRTAQHLTVGCSTCWSAVDQLPAIEPFRPSDIALREALIHLSCPESRAILASDHIVALDRAHTPPTGFALLLLAESLSIGLASSEDVTSRDPVTLDLIQTLLTEADQPLPPELQDLSAQNQIHQTLFLLQDGNLKDAGDTLMNAATLAMRGTPDPDVFVNLCEAQARWAWSHDDLEAAVASYHQATQCFNKGCFDKGCFDKGKGLGQGTRPTRRFEIHGEAAILHGLRGDLDKMALAETAAREALSHVRRGPDPIFATGAILRDAELTKRLAMFVPPEHELRARGAPRAAEALLAASDEFDRFTDALTRAQKDYCLARLYIFFDPKAATTHYRRAADGFRACQADSRSSSVRMEALLTCVLIDDDEVDSFTRPELAKLKSVLARTSAWLNLAAPGKPN